MAMVALPQGTGWHFINSEKIVAIKFAAPKKTVVFLEGGVQVEVTEETHSVRKRIDDAAGQ